MAERCQVDRQMPQPAKSQCVIGLRASTRLTPQVGDPVVEHRQALIIEA